MDHRDFQSKMMTRQSAAVSVAEPDELIDAAAAAAQGEEEVKALLTVEPSGSHKQWTVCQSQELGLNRCFTGHQSFLRI